MNRRILPTLAAVATAVALSAGILAPSATAAPTPSVALAAPAPPPDVNVVERAIAPHTLEVTVALVAPQGTTPSFDTAAARATVEAAASFFSRETDGAVTVEIDRVIDWMYVDEPISCESTGELHEWTHPRIGWQRGAGKHLVIMVPPGDPCPHWANGEQNTDIGSGGTTFQAGTDPATLAHELGHNMSMGHAASIECSNAWDFSTLGPDVPAGCTRQEYGNRLNVMGSAWTFNPLPSPTLDRIGMLPRRFEPTCGAVRTLEIASVGEGAAGREAISFVDPADPSGRYWVDFRRQADANIYNSLHRTPWEFKPNRDGLQIMRNDPYQWDAPALLLRPGSGDDHRQLTAVDERVPLRGGAWVELRGTSAGGEGIVDVFVPCAAIETALVAEHSGLCLDNSDASLAAGNAQVQWSCGSAANQRYSFVPVPGASDTYRIVNRHSGKCLDVAGAGTADGAAIVQWTCGSGQNQQFTLRKAVYSGASPNEYQVVARHSGKCLDVADASTAPGAAVVQWACGSPSPTASRNQVWALAGLNG